MTPFLATESTCLPSAAIATPFTLLVQAILNTLRSTIRTILDKGLAHQTVEKIRETYDTG
jgi:hypothetical protein